MARLSALLLANQDIDLADFFNQGRNPTGPTLCYPSVTGKRENIFSQLEETAFNKGVKFSVFTSVRKTVP